MVFHEKTSRSVLKAITFRCFVLVADGIIVYGVTHRYDLTLSVMVLSNISSTVLYFFHERIWNAIHWGKRKLSIF
jgi:uncharacterized membrane protein